MLEKYKNLGTQTETEGLNVIQEQTQRWTEQNRHVKTVQRETVKDKQDR